MTLEILQFQTPKLTERVKMSGYLINFIVYTAAMIGIIFLAVVVYKKFSYCSVSKSKFLDIEDCIGLGPRKNLYVIRAGNERFLVASDVDKTALISKLDITDENLKKVQPENTHSVDELPSIVSINKAHQPKKVFKDLINKL